MSAGIIATIRKQLHEALASLAAEQAAQYRQALADIDYRAGRAEAAIFGDDDDPEVIETEVTIIHPPAMREIERMGYRPAGAVGPGPWVYPGAGTDAVPCQPRTWLETDSESLADFISGTGNYG